jgi:hypothetical protein
MICRLLLCAGSDNYPSEKRLTFGEAKQRLSIAIEDGASFFPRQL